MSSKLPLISIVFIVLSFILISGCSSQANDDDFVKPIADNLTTTFSDMKMNMNLSATASIWHTDSEHDDDYDYNKAVKPLYLDEIPIDGKVLFIEIKKDCSFKQSLNSYIENKSYIATSDDEQITVFALRIISEYESGRYTDGTKAYSQSGELYIVDWPEMRSIAAFEVRASPPSQKSKYSKGVGSAIILMAERINNMLNNN